MTARLKAHATRLEQVGDGGERLAIIAGLAAHGEDEVAEGEVAVRDFEGLFHGVGSGLGKGLRNAGTDVTSVGREPDASAFEKIGHSGGCFVAAPADAADCEDEVTEGQGLAAAGFEGVFHGGGFF